MTKNIFNPEDQQGIVDHMNDDHSNVIQSALHAQHGIKDKNVKMFALSTDGYYVYSKKEIFFITFNKPFSPYKFSTTSSSPG